MVSPNQIVNHVERESYGPLLARILANGRCSSPAAKRLFSRPESLPAAAIGLGLQRLTELTYLPCEQGRPIVDRLLQIQRSDGMFSQECDVVSQPPELAAATAAALAGLLRWRSQMESLGQSVGPAVHEAIDAGLSALRQLAEHSLMASMPGTGKLFDAATWAIVLWQLGDQQAFRSIVSVDAVLARVAQADAPMCDDEMCRYARLMAA